MDALKQSPARISVAGVLGTIAYLLAVFAYSISPVSYAGALAGWWFLKERMGGVRVLGAVIIFTGILVIAIFG